MTVDPVPGAVVVGVDGSPCSEAAVAWAVDTASAQHCPLHVVHAASGREGDGPEAMAVLQHAVEQVRVADPAARVTTALLRGRAAKALLEASRTASCVVVGAHGRHGLAALVGSTAAAVVGGAHCPVAVVRESTARSGRVVVGVDGSEPSRLALAFAFAQAHARAVPVTAVHAWRGSDSIGLGTRVSPSEKWQQVVGGAQKLLRDEVCAVSTRYPDVHVERVSVRRDAADALLAAAHDADLLVVGAKRSRRGSIHVWAPTLLRVLERATCAVVVVPEPELAEP